MSDSISILIRAILEKSSKNQLEQELKNIESKLKPIGINANINTKDLDKYKEKLVDAQNFLSGITQKTREWTKTTGETVKEVEHLKAGTDEVYRRVTETSISYKKQREELVKTNAEQAKYWAQRRSETLNSMTSKPDALVQMSEYYKNLEKESANLVKADERLVKANNAVTNSLLKQQNAISQRDFNYGSLITGVNASTFNSGNNFSSYIRQQYGDSAELIGKFNDKALKTGEIITQANFRVKEGADKWRMYQATLNKTTGEMRMLDNGLKDVVNRQLNFSEAMKIAITRIGQWGLATSLVYGSLRQLRNGLETLKELDTLMVDINKVTNLSADAMERMKNASFDTASGYGQKAQSYLSGVAEFSRAGYEEAAGGLSEISLLAQNVGELTGEQANQFLLATDAAYKFKGSQEELTKVLDGVNQIDNKFATSIAKVSEGMTVAGSIASNAGVEVAELSSAIGVMTAVTQRSGNEAGRAFRSILMNIMQVKGETEDGEIIDDEALSKSANALDGVGIKVHELRNGIEELRNPMDVLKELADKWGSLNSMDRSSITESLGGKYRGNQLVALVENFDMYEKMLAEYASSSGSAMKENEIRLGSMQSKLNQLSNTTASFWNNTIDTDFIKGIIDSLNGLIKVLDILINNSFSSFIIQVALMSTALYGLSISFNALKASTLGTTVGVIALDVAEKGLIVTTRALTATMLASPLFWIVAGTAAIYGIIKGVTALRNANEELQNSYKKEINLLQEQEQAHNKQSQYYDSQKNSISDLSSKREKLINVLSKQTAGSKEAIATQEALGETERLLGDIAEECGLQRNATTDMIIAKLGELKLTELNGVITTQTTEREKLQAVKEGSLARLEIIQQEIAAYNNPSNWGFMETAGNFLKDINPLNFLNTEPEQLNLENLLKQQDIVSSSVKDTENQIDDLNKKINASKNAINGVKIDNIIGSKGGGKPSGSGSGSKSDAYSTDLYAKVLSSLNAQLKTLDYYKNQLSSKSPEYRNMLEKEISLQKQIQDLAHAEADSLRAQIASGSLNQEEIDKAEEKILSLGDAWREAQETIESTNFDIVNSQLSQLADNTSKVKTALDLANSELGYLTPTTDAYNTKKQESINLSNQYIQTLALEQAAIRQLMLSANLTASQLDELNNKLQDNINTLNQYRVTLLQQAASDADEAVSNAKDSINEEKEARMDALEEESDALDKHHEKIIDQYDEELDKIQEIIQAKLDLIDATEDEYDFNKDLTKLQEEKQDIQNKINTLSLDTSPEGVAKLAELRQSLADKTGEIDELQHDRSLDLQKSALEQQLEDYQTDIEAKKEAEDEKYEALKEELDDEREEYEDYYNDLADDEQHWANMRQSIIDSSNAQITSLFAQLGLNIDGTMTGIAKSIDANLIAKIQAGTATVQDLQDAVNKLNNEETSSSSSSSSSSSNSGSPSIANQTPSSTGLDNTKIGSDGLTDYTRYLRNQAINGGSVPIYHDGGIVGEQTSTPPRIVQLVNKMLNTKGNEQLIKAIQNEVYSPPQNIISNFIPNLQNLISTVSPQIAIATSSPTITNTITFNVSGSNGLSKSDLKQAADYINSQTSKYFSKKGV